MLESVFLEQNELFGPNRRIFKKISLLLSNYKEVCHGGGSESTIIIGPSKSVLVYALHSLEYALGRARFRVFVPKLYYYILFCLYSLLSYSKVECFKPLLILY